MASHDALIIYLVLVVILPILFWGMNKLLGPRRPQRKKSIAFECGQEPMRWRPSPFPFEYFPYAIIYVAYAVLAIVAFLTSVTLIDRPDAALRVILILAIISASSIYLALNLRDLGQRL